MPPQAPNPNNTDSNGVSDPATAGAGPVGPTPSSLPVTPEPAAEPVQSPAFNPAVGAMPAAGSSSDAPSVPSFSSAESTPVGSTYSPEPTPQPDVAPATTQTIGETVVTPNVVSPTVAAPEAVPSNPAPAVQPAGFAAPEQPTASPFMTAPAATEPTNQPMIVSGSDSAGPTSAAAYPGSAPTRKPKSKQRLLFAGGGVLVLLIIGYVFGFYLPNTPSNVYSAGLDHTARAYDKLVAYTKNVGDKKFQSSKTIGTFKYVSGEVSADGSFSGESSGNNGDGTLNVNIAGIKASIEGRVVTPSGQDAPDIYFQVNGVRTLLDSAGMSQFASLDGQWISVDHTLLETVAASAASDTSKPKLEAPTSAQVQDALAKIGETNRQYLFKADADHAVLKNEKYLGKSTVNGRKVYGYTVGYDKEHLKAYVKNLQLAVNNSSLNSWIKTASGKTASEADLSGLTSMIDHADGNYTFTMYVDAKTKLIDVLHFKDPKNSDYIELGQGYAGGDVFPMTLSFVSTSDPKNTIHFTLTSKLDTKANRLSLSADTKASEDNSPVTAGFDADVTFSNDAVHVTAPAGAKSVMEIYQQLGLNDILGGSTGGSTSQPAALQNFTLTQ